MKEIIFYFLRLGSIGFGGPLAIVAMMQKELVQDRKWMTDDEFRQVFGLIKAMPGPIAFQTAVFLGYRRKKFFGGLAAGFFLILPAFFLMILLAYFYQQFSEISWVQSLMKGMALGAFALILWALKALMQGFQQKIFFWVLLASGLLLGLLTHIPEPLLIVLFGGVAVFSQRIRGQSLRVFDPILLTLVTVSLKAGAFVFGTGLAIVPLLEEDFVNRLGWLNHQQFLDALSFGQLTPGPVSVTVTFIGFKVAGFLGASLATISIFLPAFVHMVTWFPRMVNWLQRQSWIGAFSLGVTAAVCSAIIISLIQLGEGWGFLHYAIIALLLVLMQRWKIPSWGVILAGGALGFLV